MSKVLLIGGGGFIGRHLAAALAEAGHNVEAPGRAAVDLTVSEEACLVAAVAGYDVAINAAGLLGSRSRNTMEAVTVEGARRVARACIAAQVPRLIHMSALGASTRGDTHYHQTKGRAEEILAESGLDFCILRPSVVIGRGGASTAFFSALAALPLPPRIGPGTWTLQPVHVDDLALLVVRLAAADRALPRRIDVVGPSPMTTTELLAALRHWLGMPPRRHLPVPERLLWPAAAISERIGDSPFTRESISMLKAGNTANPTAFSEALGRPPRELQAALASHPVEYADQLAARLYFVRPLLRWSLAVLWIATGILSFGLYPLAKSYNLLADVGIEGLIADIALFGAAALDAVLGALLLVGWRPVFVGCGMLTSMAAFTVIALSLPAEYWLHPFAPLLKNLPLATATLAMMAMEN
ncbi:SDR family oxidoreductase [Rhodomicrobium sp.]|uniref:SDR family oxidoreductase n=1 Tax=Rhodomicrobium sp. TaxID=2720632 RepID=UPI0039E50192